MSLKLMVADGRTSSAEVLDFPEQVKTVQVVREECNSDDKALQHGRCLSLGQHSR